MDLEKELTKLEKYFKKQGREELVRELRNLDNDDLRQRLMKQAVLEQEIVDTKAKEAEKPEIKEAKDTIKEFNATYREQAQDCRRIARLIHLLIEDSGKV